MPPEVLPPPYGPPPSPLLPPPLTRALPAGATGCVGALPALMSGGVGGASREGPGVFRCVMCGKSYRWRRTLLNHIKMECGKEPAFQCPYCPLRSKRKGNIAAHVRYVHMRDTQAIRAPPRPLHSPPRPPPRHAQ